MRKYLIISGLSVMLCSTNVFAANVVAYLTYATFNIPAKGPYIETYLTVVGSSVKFEKNTNGKFQGAIDIAIAFKQNGEIKNPQKYTLHSPEVSDTTKLPNFIDQQRYSLPNGSYDMEITITDVADRNKPSNKPFTNVVPIKVNFPDDRVVLSDIQLLESYTKSTTPNMLSKSGYDLVPYVSTFFPENTKKLKFYTEIYNTKKVTGEAQKIVISYFLESADSKVKLTDFSAFSKQSANDVNILLTEFDVEKLPSGNYNLVIQVIDKDNKIQAEQKKFIQRRNTPETLSLNDLKTIDVSKTFVRNYKNVDTLSEYIRCLRPISSSAEVQYSENQLAGKKLELMQQYFYNFWKSRNALEPELTWLEYSKEVAKVNKEFGTYSLKGYDTDRGRVYLQYGAPNQRNKVDTEPSAYPYEIWQYDVLVDNSLVLTNPHNNRQTNRQFVFYNPDLVTNKYTLIHSTARGETYNTAWQLLLHKRDNPSTNLDDEKPADQYGSHADEIYKYPR